MLYWHRRGTGEVSFAVGTIDPLYLFGEGAKETARTEGGQTVPETGFGNVLINCNGHNEYVCCEIKGVTDDMALLRRGDRFETE